MKDKSTANGMVPSTMRALELRSLDGEPGSLALAERPVSLPGRNEVLVRIEAAPVNPSDLVFLRGLYGLKKPLPVVPGFEGSGVVVRAGGGLLARALLGRRVACAAPPDGDGTWAEYMLTGASLCIPLRKRTSLEQGAVMIVNPLSAWALMGRARRGRHRAIAQTAAASALGQMIRNLAARRNVPVVNVVRRKEQAEALQRSGARYVLDSSETEFEERLREVCHRLNVMQAFDAVAGELTGILLRALPEGGRLTVYGALSGEGCLVDPRSLIFEGKSVEGFWLSEWLRSQSFVSKLIATARVQGLLAGDLKTEIRGRFSLEQAAQGINQYVTQMTGGKILLVPGLR